MWPQVLQHVGRVGRVVMTGTRYWPVDQPQERLRATLTLIQEHYPAKRAWVLHHGGCRGADIAAAQVAHTLGWAVRVHEADWNAVGIHRKAAGPIRNREMVNSTDATTYLVVHPKTDDLEELRKVRGSGTADCLRHMFRHPGVTFYVVTDPV